MKRGFTLTELLVVIMVIAILASSTLFAMMQSMETARVRRTRAEITNLNDHIMPMWEAYSTRPIRLVTTGGNALPPAARRDIRVMASARLNVLHDLQRMELPERITDICDGPTRIPTVPVSLPYILSNGTTVDITTVKPSVSRRYYKYADDHAGIENWTEQYEGAECLWLIMKFNTEVDIESIDKDQDNMPEVADAWGNPVEFLRWAPGYDFITPVVKDPVTSPDPFNPLKIRQNNQSPRDYMIFPLIYSPGPDGQYDINKIAGLAYSELTIPCDPYYNPGIQAGATLNNAEQVFVDNITNHNIETR